MVLRRVATALAPGWIMEIPGLFAVAQRHTPVHIAVVLEQRWIVLCAAVVLSALSVVAAVHFKTGCMQENNNT